MPITDIKDMTSFKWATVKGVSPLSIQLDGDTVPLAMVPDSLVDPTTLSVGSRVRVELSQRKAVIHGESYGGGFSSGDVKLTASATAPAGWMLCQGQSLLRSSYPGLFAAIGTTYGSADSTHFTLPDLRKRVAVGSDSSMALGSSGGAATHSHGATQMAALVGRRNGAVADANIEWQPRSTPSWNSNDHVTGSTGSTTGTQAQTRGAAIYGNTDDASTMPPYVVMNYIIKI